MLVLGNIESGGVFSYERRILVDSRSSGSSAESDPGHCASSAAPQDVNEFYVTTIITPRDSTPSSLRNSVRFVYGLIYDVYNALMLAESTYILQRLLLLYNQIKSKTPNSYTF